MWVHRDFVVDHAISAAKVYIRSGPGINYNGVGMALRGYVVSPRGEFGEWIKIAPPPGCSLWVSRSYVQVLEPEKARPAPVEEPARRSEVRRAEPAASPLPPAAAPVTRPAEAAAQPTPTGQPPSNLQLIPLEGQGRSVQRDGELRPVGFLIKRPARYRLVSGSDTICYVHGNHAQLAGYVNQRLLIRGREYWVRGVRHPVVVPEQIIPRAAE